MDFNDHLIDININVPDNFVCKHFVHQALVRYPDVLEAEWHLLIINGVAIGMKGRLFFVFSCHLNLMITLVGINETFKLKIF